MTARSLAASIYAIYPKARPLMMKAVKFFIPEERALQVHAESLFDWPLWWNLVRPPFETTFVEIDPAYLPRREEPDAAARLGWLWSDGKGYPWVMSKDGDVVPVPFVYETEGSVDGIVSVGRTPDEADEAVGRKMLWGAIPNVGADAATLMPPFSIKMQSKYPDPVVSAFLRESAGNARMAFACLAAINMPHQRHEERPEARHLIRGQATPKMIFRTLHIHTPPPVVLDPGGPAEEGYSTPRREHDVRGYTRTLKGGRTIWVRAHKRGDRELGRVEKEYVVG